MESNLLTRHNVYDLCDFRCLRLLAKNTSGNCMICVKHKTVLKHLAELAGKLGMVMIYLVSPVATARRDSSDQYFGLHTMSLLSLSMCLRFSVIASHSQGEKCLGVTAGSNESRGHAAP